MTRRSKPLSTRVKATRAKFLYTAGSSVTAFSVNQQTGSLTQIATYPVKAGSEGVIVTPNGKFLYSTGDGISALSVDATSGTLTAIPGSTFDSSVAFSAYLSHKDAVMPSIFARGRNIMLARHAALED